MSRLRELSEKVKVVLEENEASRNDDNILYLHLLRNIGSERGVDIDKMSVPMLLLHCRDLGFPSQDSVGRARRKVQNLYPELRANEEVQVIRELEEDKFRKYAKEVHYVGS